MVVYGVLGSVYLAPIAPHSAFSNEIMLGTPMFGVATGTLLPVFCRFVSAILAQLFSSAAALASTAS